MTTIKPQQRILVTGITSIHGWPIWNAIQGICDSQQLMGIRPPQTKAPLGENVVAMCITDREQLEQIRDRFQPTCVIHCAGVCDLDLCEERPHWAHDLNVNGMKAVTEVFGATCQIVYMSTDLVFSGEESPASGYAEEHCPDPISVAGKTFLQAEQVLQELEDTCIVRLGLPLGDSITGTKGAVDWIKGRLTKDRPVTLFYDELRSCVWCDQIAEMTLLLLSQNLRGVYHFGGNRPWQLYEIGQYVLDKYNCPEHLLKGIYRHEETNGPPRIGDVSMDCSKLKTTLNDVEITISDFN